MNSLTLFAYYLSDVHLPIRERMDPVCFDPGTLAVIHNGQNGPPDARLIATIQGFDGTPKYTIFLTR